MKNENILKTTAIGSGIAIGCCFGVVGFILGILGLTTALAYVNKFGDFLFFPAFAAFGTILIYSLMQWKRNMYTYLLSLVTIGIMIYFTIFGIAWFLLILSGAIAGGIITLIIRKNRMRGK